MKPVKGPRLGSGPAHQKLMLGSLAAALIAHERIRTTETKAKRLRPVADRLITLGKDGTVHARRRALSIVEDRAVVHKLFAEVAPRFAERPGGYTRILRLGPRHGDAAPMAIIEFVEEAAEPGSAGEAAGTKTRRVGRRRGRKAEKQPVTGAAREKPPAPAAGTAEAEETAAEPVVPAEPEATPAAHAAAEAEAADPKAESDGPEEDQSKAT